MTEQAQHHAAQIASEAPKPRARTLLQVERLSKLFPVRRGFFSKPFFVHAVDAVTLYVKRGETLGLAGESGCGKTTLGRSILRLIEPTYGRIVFDGRELSPLSQRQLRPLRRHMQIIFQDPYASLNPRMTVFDTVAEGIRIHGLARGRADLHARVDQVLSSVGLEPIVGRRYPHEFSAGQRQRIGIARALAVEPSFLVCDEPVSALDVSIRAQIVNLLLDQQQARGLSYLFISHDLGVVRHVAHRTAIMYSGRILEVGPTAEIFEHPRHPYTRALIDAIPVPDPAAPQRMVLAPGEPADPLRAAKGCVFRHRCSRAAPRCEQVRPTLDTETSPGSHHRFACWYPEDS